MSAFPQSRGSAPISQIGFILSFGHCFGECRFGHVTEGPPVLRWRHRPRHRYVRSLQGGAGPSGRRVVTRACAAGSVCTSEGSGRRPPREAVPVPWDDAADGALEGRAWPSPRVRRLLVFLGGAPGAKCRRARAPRHSPCFAPGCPRVVARLLAAPPAARSEKPLLGRRRPAGWGPRTGGDRRWLGGRGWGFGLRGGCGVGTASSFSSARGVLVPKSLPDQSSRWEILKEADYVRNHITALPVAMVIELFTPKKLM